MDMDDVIFKGQSNDPHEVNLLQHMSQFFTQLSKFLAPTGAQEVTLCLLAILAQS